MNELLDDLRRYLRALETGDPNRQLCNPDDDQVIVRAAIAEIEQLQKDLETERMRLAACGNENERLKGALDFAPDEIPTNWLDPLLTGPDAIADLYSPKGVERLLLALKERMRAYCEQAAASGDVVAMLRSHQELSWRPRQ